MPPKLIPMLTYNDETVEDAFDLFQASKDAPTDHWGFKDVGLEPGEMKDLVQAMKEAGKTTYLEGVRYSEEECLNTAELALDCGFDHLMGTIFHKSVKDLLSKHEINYSPFCGQVHSHPSVLEGDIDEIIKEGNDYASQGVDGFDLLAYRYTGDPEELARKFIEAMELPVILAGSIASYERLDVISELNPDAFTIGTAFFEKKFEEGAPFATQIERVVNYLNR